MKQMPPKMKHIILAIVTVYQS